MRPLPHDDAAEEAVLGAVLADPDLFPEIAAAVEAGDFYRSTNRTIFEAASRVDARRQAPDVLAVIGELRSNGHGAVDPMHVRDLAADVGVVSVGPQHAARVAALAKHRRLVQRLNAGLEAALDGLGDPAAFASELSGDILDLTEVGDGVARSIGDLVADALDALERGPEGAGLQTGFVGLDHLIGGLKGGQLVLVAARPGVGKSSFATVVARNVARLGAVAFFSLEMNAEEIAIRLICGEAGVSYAVLRAGRATLVEWERLAGAAERFVELPLVIDDRSVVKLPEIRAAARRVRGLGLVVVDYVQLMTSARNRGSRQEEVSDVSRGLKLLAKELNVPVLACCQVNREVEKRQDKRPTLADLRESGALEQDADVVLLLHRDSVVPQRAEVIVAKQRNGPTGSVRITFESDVTSFKDSSW